MTSLTHLLVSTVDIFRLVGQAESTSTKVYPFPSFWIWRALRMAARALRMCAGSVRATRSTKTGALRALTNSHIWMG